MIGESVFFAAFVGALVGDIGLIQTASQPGRRDLSKIVLRACSAGYVALCVIRLERVELAFGIGLAFDLCIVTIRRAAIRLADRMENHHDK
jgi:hypothetical protein